MIISRGSAGDSQNVTTCQNFGESHSTDDTMNGAFSSAVLRT
jgi:hypothetical protein